LIGDRQHRIGAERSDPSWYASIEARLGAGLALLTVGFLAGYVVGLVTGEEEFVPIDVAFAPSAGPMVEAPNIAEETPVPPIAPTAHRAVPATPLAVPSERPPPLDVAVTRLPVAPPSDAMIAEVPQLRVPSTGPMIAIVIDDLGLLEAATESAIALDPSFTLAFLPYGDKASDLATKAHKAGHEVLLHMPMEPDGPFDPGPDALLTGLDHDEIRKRLGLALARVPPAMGLNNHMGSRFTTDAEAMAVVLDEVNARGMMMLDSVTTPNSVVGDLAQALGVPSGSRDVFLDNNRDPALIHQQLDELERIARATGSAIALGHPYQETIAVLTEWLPAARQRGFRLVPLSRLTKPRLQHPMIAAQLPDDDDERR